MRRIAELTWADLAALDRARTVVFLPISPIEAHGPHLPAGTDAYIAQAFAEHLAAEIERRHPEVECLLAPLVPLGCGVLPMIGTLGVRWLNVRNVAAAMGGALARDGYRTIVAVSGHMGLTHLVALERAAKAISRRYGVRMLAPALPVGRAVLAEAALQTVFAQLAPALTPGELRSVARPDHGGMLETSVMLHLHPELVRPVYQALPPVTRLSYLTWRGRRATHGFQGYVGDPARARPEIGAAVVTALTEAAATLVEEALWAGEARTETAQAETTHPQAQADTPRRLWRWTLASAGAVAMLGAVMALGRRGWRWLAAPGLPTPPSVGSAARRGSRK